MAPVLLGLIAHIIGDFLFQTDNIIEEKQNGKLKGLFLHWLCIFVPTFVLFLLYDWRIAIFFAISLSLIHILIDVSKTFLLNKFDFQSDSADLNLFLIDQLLHVLVIFILYKTIFPAHLSPILTSITFFGYTIKINTLLLCLFFYLMASLPSSFFISKVLNLVNIDFEEENEASIGKYIGIIERLIIMTLVAFGAFSSIGIIFTAKSVVRHQKFDNKTFLEYYLLGTLCSIFIGLLFGLGMKYSILFHI